jgi:hypothetical protein
MFRDQGILETEGPGRRIPIRLVGVLPTSPPDPAVFSTNSSGTTSALGRGMHRDPRPMGTWGIVIVLLTLGLWTGGIAYAQLTPPARTAAASR